MTRREYQMTEAQLITLMEACSMPLVTFLQSGVSPSAQDRAGRAWLALGRELGFDATTVEPIRGKGPRFFTAEPLGALQ